jgi:cytoskeleton protein RodZ
MNVGSRLHKAREAKGLSLDSLSKTTRVKVRILEAIENNDAAAIPPRPYGRGFVRTYAGLVGLDPDETVRDYFLQFAPPRVAHVEPPAQTRAFRSDLLWARAAAFRSDLLWARAPYFVAGVLLLGFVLLGAQGLVSRDAPPVVTQPAAPVTPNSADSTESRAPAPKPRAALTVQLEATDPVWVAASADGQRTIYRTMRPGERETLRGDREIAIRVGDAGAVRLRINDRPDAVMGARGAVQSTRLTPNNVDAQPSSLQAPTGSATTRLRPRGGVSP